MDTYRHLLFTFGILKIKIFLKNRSVENIRSNLMYVNLNIYTVISGTPCNTTFKQTRMKCLIVWVIMCNYQDTVVHFRWVMFYMLLEFTLTLLLNQYIFNRNRTNVHNLNILQDTLLVWFAIVHGRHKN